MRFLLICKTINFLKDNIISIENSTFSYPPSNSALNKAESSLNAQDFDCNVKNLENKYNEIKSKRGLLKYAYSNGAQNKGLLLKCAYSSRLGGLQDNFTKKEDSFIEEYKNNEITYEQAQKRLSTIEATDTVTINTFTNMLTSILSTLTALAVKAGNKKSSPLVYLAGILTAVFVKVGIKTIDRATNDIKGDTIDLKQMGKDALTGAINGLFSSANASFGKKLTQKTIGIKAGVEILKQAGMLMAGKLAKDFYMKKEDENP